MSPRNQSYVVVVRELAFLIFPIVAGAEKDFFLDYRKWFPSENLDFFF